MGNNFHYYLKDMCQGLGKNKCQVRNFFHVFTGRDTTPQFLGKGQKSSWVAWTAAFQYVFQDLFMKVNKNSMCFKLIERFS